MCDLLFSALLIVSQAFTGVSCPTIIAFVSTHGSSFTYILGSQMLRGSRGKGTDGESVINTETLKKTFSIKMNSGEFLENTPQIVPYVETILCMYNILDVERCGQF